jgi:hypothetical protein
MVVDQRTNLGIEQAFVSVDDRPERYVTKENGYFRLVAFAGQPATITLHVSKAGYQPLDKTVELPADHVTLPLLVSSINKH